MVEKVLLANVELPEGAAGVELADEAIRCLMLAAVTEWVDPSNSEDASYWLSECRHRLEALRSLIDEGMRQRLESKNERGINPIRPIPGIGGAHDGAEISLTMDQVAKFLGESYRASGYAPVKDTIAAFLQCVDGLASTRRS